LREKVGREAGRMRGLSEAPVSGSAVARMTERNPSSVDLSVATFSRKGRRKTRISQKVSRLPACILVALLVGRKAR
jgi:hypothetical protein